nr:YwqG family protein [uncultured Bacillus sp.]
MVKLSVTLPQDLEPYREQIEKTVKPVVRIKAVRGETTPYESKFGGYPYMPKGFEHPRDKEGNPMVLFAQINFTEVPHIDPMPEKGILQIFLSPYDDVYGLDFDDPTNQENFRIVYHREVLRDETQLVLDFSYVPEMSDDIGPICSEGRMSFELQQLPVSTGTYQFEELLDIDLDQDAEENPNEALWDIYTDVAQGEGHKIGGYPYFTQYDPRDADEEYQKYNILLFQADMDDGIDLMFGDSGIANFFIKEEDLKNLNFSNVLYNWDCC